MTPHPRIDSTPARPIPSSRVLAALFVALGLLSACSSATVSARSERAASRSTAGAAAGATTRSMPIQELPVVAWFEDYQTVFSGTYVRTHHLFPRAFDLTDATKTLRCSGPAPLIDVPAEADPPRTCDGMAGIAVLRCSDDREVEIRWIADPDCRSGYGQGIDAEGHRFLLFFGGSEPLAATALSEAIESQREKPKLPAVGRDGEAGLGTGTGFFVSRRGHLVTNHHVIEDATRVLVALEDGDEVEAEVLARDEKNDLALLKVSAIRTPLRIRKDPDLERGTQVVALGYPLIPLQGRDQKATIGHINALSGPRGDPRFTQIDAAVQPGNSGGPLLDKSGAVMGVVTLILSPTATLQATGTLPQNVNYAIKPDLVRQLLRRTLGEDWSGGVEEGPSAAEWPELISRVEDSVVLVVTER